MKILSLIFTLSFLHSCSSREKSGAPESHSENEVPIIKKSREIESLIMNNGIITDTIFKDELSEKILVKNYKILDNELFICYSKYKVEEPLKEDLSFYSRGNYIGKSKDVSLKEKIGSLIAASDVELKESILLCSSCSHDDKIYFDKITSKKLFYASVPVCSELYHHQVFSKKDSTYILEFEFESYDSWINFKLINDSTITANYTGFSETGNEKFNFKHIFQSK
ncbi:hypothetical protein [Marinifilum fragile]